MKNAPLEKSTDSLSAESDLQDISSSRIPRPSANQVIAGIALSASIYHAVNNPVSSPLATTGLSGVYNNVFASVAAGTAVVAAKLKMAELAVRALKSTLGWGRERVFGKPSTKDSVKTKKKSSNAPQKVSHTIPSSRGIHKPHNREKLLNQQKIEKSKSVVEEPQNTTVHQFPAVTPPSFIITTETNQFHNIAELTARQKSINDVASEHTDLNDLQFPNFHNINVADESLNDDDVAIENNEVLVDTSSNITATTQESRGSNQRQIPLYQIYCGGSDSHINPHIIRTKRGRENDCFAYETQNKRPKK